MAAAIAPEKAKAQTTHEPGVVFEVDGQHTMPCSCGKQYTSDTPAKAAARWRGHLPKIPKPATASVSERVRECGCGCGGKLAARAGGLFLSGHDARFKSMLARAQSAGEQVRHPSTGELSDPLSIALWLDERRANGGPVGTFWRDKVAAGLKNPAQTAPRSAKPRAEVPLSGEAKAAHLIEMLDARRPAPGQEGFYIRKDGRGKYPAKVVRRVSDEALCVRVLDGPMRNQEVVIPDERFEKIKKGH